MTVKWNGNRILCGLLAVLMLLGITGLSKSGYQPEEQLFRLHILANSDAPEDQALKLSVRDAILPLVKEQFDGLDIGQYAGSSYAEKAASAAKQLTGVLSSAAQRAVYENGSTQTAAVMVGYEAFPDRVYGAVTVPAGNYWCLRIVLGSGKGQNWWCVLYPPLCLSPAAEEAYLKEYGTDILTGTENYRFRFAIWDWFCKWRTKR